MSAISFNATKESDTHAIAARLAALCAVGDVLLLEGDLGAGKTSFSRAFIHALQDVPEEVLSPTFSLLQTYGTRMGWMIYHFDLYRLKSPEELIEIGLDDALTHGLTLIEWPQIAAEQLPEHALAITLQIQDDGIRIISFSGKDAKWQERLQKLKKMV